jgi:hypothetical protein
MNPTTTLAAPCGIDDEQVLVVSAAGITDPGINNTTPCFLLVDTSQYSEYMQVQVGYVEGSLTVPVVRGFNGTISIPHAIGVPVQVLTELTQGVPVLD